jgi:sugar O-acyltransferase (sialic acid O-acetyltransferase NeuD family)
MPQKIAIIGAGGFGREVLDIVEACNAHEPTYDILGFIVEEGFGNVGTLVNGRPILGYFDWVRQHTDDVLFTCAVGAPQHRRRLVNSALECGANFATLIHPAAVVTSRVSVAPGAIITAGCILTNNIDVGFHVHINLACTVGHDAVLQDFVTLAPGVHVSGNVTISEGAYVGTGASIIEKVSIGQWSIVGAGAVVVRDVPRDSTVIGVPAKVIKSRDAGWHESNDADNA